MFPAHCFMLFPVLQFTQRKRVMIIKIDMKALSSNECIIMTPIMNWLFEKHNAIFPGYFGVQSLNSFKARAQLLAYRQLSLNTVLGKFCDGWFLRLASQYQGSRHQDVLSRRLTITFIADRNITDRKSQIALSNQSLCASYTMLRYATSHIGRWRFVKIFHLRALHNVCDAMNFASLLRSLLCS